MLNLFRYRLLLGMSIAALMPVLTGAESLLNGEDGLAIDFSDQSIAIRDTTTPANNISSSGTVRDGALVGPGAKITYTSPSPKLCKKQDGTYGYRAQNLILQSEDFSKASWVKTNMTSTAGQIVETAASGFHLCRQAITTTIVSGVSLSFAVEIKPGGRRYVGVEFLSGTWNGGVADATAIVDTQLGTFYNTLPSHLSNVSVSTLVDGYLRVTGVVTPTSNASAITLGISHTTSSTVVVSFAGTASIYTDVRCAHLRSTLAATDYIKTTTIPLYDLPYDWTGTYYYPLCEPAATNLFLNSRAAATQNFSVTAQAYTLSFIGTGTITLSGASTAGPLVGTGANDRVSLAFTPSAGTLTLTVSGTMDLVQLETGTVATSPIITAGATVTRAADDLSVPLSAFPSIASAVTMYAVYSQPHGHVTAAVLSHRGGNNNNRVEIETGSSTTSRPRGAITTAGVSQMSQEIAAAAYVPGTFTAVALAATTNDANVARDGTVGTTDTSVTMPSTTQFIIGSRGGGVLVLNGHFKEIMVLPRRVSDAELPLIGA